MRRVLICCSMLIALSPGALGSGAFSSERVVASYVLSWGSFEVAKFDITLTTDDAAYRIAYTAWTTGLAGTLFPFTSAGSSEGQMAALGPVPERYVGASERRAGRSAWTVIFRPDGEIAHVDVTTVEDEERDPVPVQLRKGPDPLALALRATRAATPGVRFGDTSFDGKRAVTFELACDEAERAVQTEQVAGIEINRLLSCTLDGDVAAGQSRRWKSGRDADRRPAEVLLTQEIVPGRYWPVRVEAATRFGAVIAQITDLR